MHPSCSAWASVRFVHAPTAFRRAVARRELDFDAALV